MSEVITATTLDGNTTIVVDRFKPGINAMPTIRIKRSGSPQVNALLTVAGGNGTFSPSSNAEGLELILGRWFQVYHGGSWQDMGGGDISGMFVIPLDAQTDLQSRLVVPTNCKTAGRIQFSIKLFYGG